MDENENTSYVRILDSTFTLAKDLHFHLRLENCVSNSSTISCLPKPPRAVLGSFKDENIEHYRQILSFAI